MSSVINSKMGCDASEPEVYDINGAAAILQVAPVTIRRLCARGRLRALRSIRHVRIPAAEIARFLAADLDNNHPYKN